MSGFPLVLLGQWDALWSRVDPRVRVGVPDLGLAMYLWSGVLYLIQVGDGDAPMPKVGRRALAGREHGPRASRGVAHPPKAEDR